MMCLWRLYHDLGHSSITITEDSYGEVVQKKVSEQMRRLNGVL